MYQHFNENPLHKNVGDCTVRAISKALNRSWDSVYTALCVKGYEMCDLPSSNAVWGAYLLDCGFSRHILPEICTVADFAEEHGQGIYILATGSHVVCVSDGIIYDSWDSSAEVPTYYYTKE